MESIIRVSILKLKSLIQTKYKLTQNKLYICFETIEGTPGKAIQRVKIKNDIGLLTAYPSTLFTEIVCIEVEKAKRPYNYAPFTHFITLNENILNNNHFNDFGGILTIYEGQWFKYSAHRSFYLLCDTKDPIDPIIEDSLYVIKRYIDGYGYSGAGLFIFTAITYLLQDKFLPLNNKKRPIRVSRSICAITKRDVGSGISYLEYRRVKDIKGDSYVLSGPLINPKLAIKALGHHWANNSITKEEIKKHKIKFYTS